MHAGIVSMNYRKVLVFGAHPDDELTMAPVMAKLVQRGVEVVVAMFTDGCEGYPEPAQREQIVALRRREQEACDRLLGTRRIRYDIPDMALTNDKATFLRVLATIRQERPDAVFTHGTVETHRDHQAVHELTVEAVWQAGEPVSAALGEPWHTPHFWYYKNCGARPPDLLYDITGYAHYRQLSLATQVSQHVLFKRSREEFEQEAAAMQAANAPAQAPFWLAARTSLRDFPDVD